MLGRAARDLQLDPVEIRRRNLVRRDEFPYTTAFGYVFESGSYLESLEVALDKGGYARWREEQARGRREGRHLGIGLSCFIELTAPGSFYGSGGAPISAQDSATGRVEPGGTITALIGVTNQGPGADPAFAQIIADQLGVSVEDVNVMSGDTALVPYGGGTSRSRGAVLRARASILARRAVGGEGRRGAGPPLPAGPRANEPRGGEGSPRGAPDRSLTLADIGFRVYYQSD